MLHPVVPTAANSSATLRKNFTEILMLFSLSLVRATLFMCAGYCCATLSQQLQKYLFHVVDLLLLLCKAGILYNP
jgi:hypothetical protein